MQALEAVDALHEGGILHRDIKPENMLITSSSNLILNDFDISCHQSDEQTCLVGTDRFRSPRLSSSAPAWQAGDDLLSLGLSFAELLAIYQLHDSSPEAKWRALRGLKEHSVFSKTHLADRIAANMT